MVTKLLHLKPKFLPFEIVSPKSSRLSKPNILAFFSTQSQTDSLPYGPSLRKGKSPIQTQQSPPRIPIQPEENSMVEDIDEYEEKFSRVFDIAALRVPANDCFALESRLRGHLLNWPRIRNIARVPGDDVDEEVRDLIEKSGNLGEEGSEASGATDSLVLYRDELVKKFNSKGYMNFRNLAKISRPPSKRKRNDRKGEDRKGNERKKIYELEVIGEEEEAEEEMKALLGEGFRGEKKWRGSTRLLLLDESYADRGVKELPQAIQVGENLSVGHLNLMSSMLIFLFRS